MKKVQNMDIVFLLDRSGSMAGIESDTIGGYNSYINSVKDSNSLVTTVLFDDKYEMINDRKDISKVKKLTNKTYFVRGCTALMDAIGKSISYMDEKKSKKALFIITTDGLENASVEYNKEKIKELIKNHKNYEFMYIGANIDSYSEGRSIGISDKNISNYKKDKKGVSTLFGSLSKATRMYCESDCVCADWKTDLEEYVNNNIE